MCSLSIFQAPPPSGYVTVCERNGQLLAVTEKDVEKSTLLQNLQYPEVTISSDLMRPSITRETARSAFLEHNDTLGKRLLHAWYEHGLTGLLEEMASSKDTGSPLMSSISCKLLGAVRWLTALHGSLFPHLAMSREDLIAEFSTNVNWKDSPIRCFAWHPHVSKFAIALRDDSVHIHTAHKHDIVPILKHKLQKGVADIAWKPLSASILAVACQTCTLIWQVDPMSLATRPSSSSVQILNQPVHAPVTSLAWCPTSGILVTASPADSSMMVWDVATEICVPLRRVDGGGVSLLQWSPDGSRLFSACPSPVFRVWENQRWTCERWSKLLGRCQAACWSPDASVLLFTTAEEPVVYSLTFGKGIEGMHSVIGGSKVAVASADVAQIDIETESGTVRVGGRIQSMAWDPSGERLAVQFKDGSSGLIALFQTRLQPTFEIIPCGFVQGFPGDIPLLINFQPKFEQGALLTVVWLSGRINYVPLYFLRREAVEDRQIPADQGLNGNIQHTTFYANPPDY